MVQPGGNGCAYLGRHEARHILSSVGKPVARLQRAVVPWRQQDLGSGEPGLPTSTLRKFLVDLHTAPRARR